MENSEQNTSMGRLAHIMFYLAPSLGICYALMFSDCSQGIYSKIPLPIGSNTTHMLTFITLCASFILYYHRMKYLYPLTRFIAALALMVMSIHLYDFLWSLQSWIFRGTKLNTPSVVIMSIVGAILFRLDNVNGVFKKTQRTTPLILFLAFVMFVGFTGMYFDGFWEKMNAIDAGIPTADPNKNIWWVLSKIPSFFVYYPTLDNRSIKAPLRLEPGVFK